MSTDIVWTQDDEKPNRYWADIGQVTISYEATEENVKLTAVIAGLESIPGTWVQGTAEKVEDAKGALVELVPTVLAAATAWLYNGTPGWVVKAMQPKPRPVVTDPAALCRRLAREREVSMDPRLVGRGVPALTPSEEGKLIAEYGFEGLVRYYCPHDPRLREIRPRPSSKWLHVKSGREYQVIGIGRLQIADPKWDMTELVLYGNPGDPMIWARPLDEFVDGRFQVPTDVVETVDRKAAGDTPLAMVLETDELSERDDGDISGGACKRCGQWVGQFHTVGCEGATPTT
jgi:hypothetical protein